MKEYKDSYERLSVIISILLSEDYFDLDGKPMLTIKKIVDLTGIEESVVRNDVQQLLSDGFFKECFIVEGIKAENELDEFLKMLKQKSIKAADVKIGLDSDYFYGEYRSELKKIAVMLSPLEKNIFAKNMHRSGISEAVWIKDTVFMPTERDYEISEMIQDAIEDNKKISFIYDNEQIDCFNPVKIYENMEDKMLYCFGYNADMEPELMRLDKIRVPEVSDSEVILPDDVTEFLEKMEYTWGADLPEGDIYHVKLKIFKETANIFDKIKAETNNRKHRNIYEDEKDENIAYYEDDVIGDNSLRKWLRKYGASVVVVEPDWLAEKMLESAERRLAVYKEILG